MKLGLAGTARAFEELQTQPAAGELAPAEWLGLLLDREVTERQDRRLRARLRFANSSRVQEDIREHMGRQRSDTTQPTAAPETWQEDEAARWTEIRAEWLRRHPALTTAEVAVRAGRGMEDPSALLGEWAEAKRVFALVEGPRLLYPAFQFRKDGQPKDAFRQLLTALEGTLDGWAVAIWLTKPNAEFGDWATPLEMLARDPKAVVQAAQIEMRPASF